MKSVNETIADAIRSRGIILSRLEASQRKKIIKMLDKLLGQLALDINDVGLGGQYGTDYQKYRLKELFKAAQEAIRATYGDISSGMTRTLSGLMGTEAAWIVKTLNNSIGTELITLGLTQEQIIAAASDALILNAPSAEWWSRQSEKLMNNFKDTIRQGWLRGETNAQLLRRLTSSTDEEGFPIFDLRMGTRRGAEAVIRSSVQQIANDARTLVYRENANVVKGVMWVSTLDQRTTQLCASLDGLVWDLDGNPIGHDRPYSPPPRHWGCVPGDSLVLPIGRVSSASKRWIEGELVFIKTASDNVLACTPNHPILTSCGWVRASEVNKVGDVISHGVIHGEALPDCNVKHVPAPIEETVRAFLRSSSVLSGPMPTSPEDFHGDGVASKIAIVGADRELWDGGYAAFGQKSGEFRFKGGLSSGSSEKAGSSHSEGFADFLRSAAHRIVGSLHKRLPLLKRGPVHPGLLLLGLIPDVNTLRPKNPKNDAGGRVESLCNPPRAYPVGIRRDNLIDWNITSDLSVFNGNVVFAEDALNNLIGDSKFSGDLGMADPFVVAVDDGGFVNSAPPGTGSFLLRLNGGFSVRAFVDKVESFSVREFSGYVYNLQTKSGIYSSGNIITHNCRSTTVPVLKSFRELGIDMDEMPESTRASMDGQVPEGLSFDDWLRRKESEEPGFVAEMFGKGKAKLWLEGKIRVRDMTDQTGRELTLKELIELFG